MSLSEFIFGLVVYIGVAAVVLIIRNRKFNKLANDNTQLFERIDFYKKKWIRKNLVKIIIGVVISLIVYIIGFFYNIIWVFQLGGCLLIGILNGLHYDMMVYVEEKAFNGKGKE